MGFEPTDTARASLVFKTSAIIHLCQSTVNKLLFSFHSLEIYKLRLRVFKKFGPAAQIRTEASEITTQGSNQLNYSGD